MVEAGILQAVSDESVPRELFPTPCFFCLIAGFGDFDFAGLHGEDGGFLANSFCGSPVARSVIHCCPYRKSNPSVMVVESTEE